MPERSQPPPARMAEPLADDRPRVLLTGFDPFGSEALNPSWLTAKALDGATLSGHRLVAAQLPTVFGDSLDELHRLIRLHRPVMVVCIGQAGGRSAISLERIAINIDDARIADNAGAQPVDRPVIKGGPAARFGTLPIKAMLKALQQAGIAAEVSQTAGTFVCNHVFYGLMHSLARQPASGRARGGFIHVPWLPAQGSPSMELETMISGLRLSVGCALRTRHDIVKEAGALD